MKALSELGVTMSECVKNIRSQDEAESLVKELAQIETLYDHVSSESELFVNLLDFTASAVYCILSGSEMDPSSIDKFGQLSSVSHKADETIRPEYQQDFEAKCLEIREEMQSVLDFESLPEIYSEHN